MLHSASSFTRVAWVLCLLCALGCNKGSPSTNPALDQPPQWSLSDSEPAPPASAFQMGEFEIRPPEQFRFTKHDPATQSYYWVGPVRDDETYAQLIVIMSDLSEHEARSSLEKLFEGSLAAIKQRRENWTRTEIERGRINGHPFVRASWSGVVTPAAREGLAGRTMHGVTYLGLDGKRAVQIQYQDVAPNHVESLKLGEAAASTFRPSASKADPR
jgi:hypothetical protein